MLEDIVGLWWLSFFTDPSRPRGDRFGGVALIEADDMRAAITRAWAEGCNPGGEVLAGELDLDALPNDKRVLLARAPHHVLLDREALERLGLAD